VRNIPPGPWGSFVAKADTFMVKTEELLLMKGMERSHLERVYRRSGFLLLTYSAVLEEGYQMKLQDINALAHLGIMKGSVVSISMIRTFFSINLHLLIFPLGEMRNQMLGIRSFHHQQKGFFQRHSLPYLTPEIQPCCLSSLLICFWCMACLSACPLQAIKVDQANLEFHEKSAETFNEELAKGSAPRPHAH